MSQEQMDKGAALTGMDGIYNLGALPNIYNMVTTLVIQYKPL